MNPSVASCTLAILLTCCVAVLPDPALAETQYETIRDLVYAQHGEHALRADVYHPTGGGPFPAVLCVHGGAWMFGNKLQMTRIARTLAEHGYTAVSINHRLAPQHKFPAQIEDCRDAVRWMRRHATEYKINSERIGGWGYSSGGHLVTLLGMSGDADLADRSGKMKPPPADQSSRIQVVIAWGAPCDFRAVPADNEGLVYWLGDTRRRNPDAYRKASPIEFVSPDDPPILFCHGKNDHMVKIDQPTAMVSRLKSVGVIAEMCVVPEAGHIGTFLDDAALAEAVRFLDKHLKQ